MRISLDRRRNFNPKGTSNGSEMKVSDGRCAISLCISISVVMIWGSIQKVNINYFRDKQLQIEKAAADWKYALSEEFFFGFSEKYPWKVQLEGFMHQKQLPKNLRACPFQRRRPQIWSWWIYYSSSRRLPLTRHHISSDVAKNAYPKRKPVMT